MDHRLKSVPLVVRAGDYSYADDDPARNNLSPAFKFAIKRGSYEESSGTYTDD